MGCILDKDSFCNCENDDKKQPSKKKRVRVGSQNILHEGETIQNQQFGVLIVQPNTEWESGTPSEFDRQYGPPDGVLVMRSNNNTDQENYIRQASVTPSQFDRQYGPPDGKLILWQNTDQENQSLQVSRTPSQFDRQYGPPVEIISKQGSQQSVNSLTHQLYERIQTYEMKCVECDQAGFENMIYQTCNHVYHYECLRKRIYQQLSINADQYIFTCSCNERIAKNVRILDKNIQNTILDNQLKAFKERYTDQISKCKKFQCIYFQIGGQAEFCPECSASQLKNSLL